MKEETLGKGKVFIGQVEKEGMIGLLFHPTDIEYPINSKNPEWKAGMEYSPHDEDIIIWIESLESARVLQDRVNIICLQLNDFQVGD